jgi:cell fate (sporulation/competence/biofilm development) regulator YmcA (YheA/YmcA/DUF963 family)
VAKVAGLDAEHPILQRVRQFAELLKQTEEVRRFRLAEEQVQNSETVQKCIETIKRKQKEWVHAKHYQKLQYARLLEKELEQLNRDLENLPIVREFQQAQVEVNDLLQTIQQAIANTVSHKIEVETGGPVRSGCGNGGPCGCS